MTIQPAVLILSNPSVCLRRLALVELLGRGLDDPEVQELTPLCTEDPLVSGLASSQGPDGSWKAGDLPGAPPRSRLLSTTQALLSLGYFGFSSEFPPVRKAAEYLFSLQSENGSWPLPEAGTEEEGHQGYTLIPLQTALPLRALSMAGYAQDPRSEKAFNWLLEQRLPDGAWPTGWAAGVHGFVAGYRRLAHSRWGCRSNTTGALACLALHPILCHGPEAQRALDLILGRETREQYGLGFETARMTGAEESRGFFTYYARYDLAQILDLCWRVDASLEDERIQELVAFITRLQGPFGLWDYPRRPQASHWITFDVLRSLTNLGYNPSWTGLEPRTPFRPYPSKQKRF